MNHVKINIFSFRTWKFLSNYYISRTGNEKKTWTKPWTKHKNNPTFTQQTTNNTPSKNDQETHFFTLSSFTNLSKLLQTDQRRSKLLETLRKIQKRSRKSKTIKSDQSDQERSKNDQGLWKTIKSDQKNQKTIKNFLNLHLTRKWPKTIWNHSGSFLELLKTFFKFFRPNFKAIPLKTLYKPKL